MAYTKLSNEKFQNSNFSTFENNISSISSTANQEFCIPCKGNGNTYTDVDGKSVQCNTIANYLLTTDGKNALIAAMQNIENTNTFKFNISGNAATATNAKDALGTGNILYSPSSYNCGGSTYQPGFAAKSSTSYFEYVSKGGPGTPPQFTTKLNGCKLIN